MIRDMQVSTLDPLTRVNLQGDLCNPWRAYFIVCIKFSNQNRMDQLTHCDSLRTSEVNLKSSSDLLVGHKAILVILDIENLYTDIDGLPWSVRC